MWPQRKRQKCHLLWTVQISPFPPGNIILSSVCPPVHFVCFWILYKWHSVCLLLCLSLFRLDSFLLLGSCEYSAVAQLLCYWALGCLMSLLSKQCHCEHFHLAVALSSRKTLWVFNAFIVMVAETYLWYVDCVGPQEYHFTIQLRADVAPLLYIFLTTNRKGWST